MSSSFWGVTKLDSWGQGSWRAQIKIGAHNINLGHFEEEADAARAHDSAAFHVHKGWVTYYDPLPKPTVNPPGPA